jgi:putative ABC transport system permease protein
MIGIGPSSGRDRRYRGAWLLLLLAFAAALFAAAVPGVIEKSQSSSLQQALDAASPVNRAVLAEPVRDAATAPAGSRGPDAAILGQILGSLAAGVPDSAGPRPGLGWDGVSLAELIPESARGAAARTNLEYRSDETSHMRVLSGTMPDSATDAGGTLVLDVAVTKATADRYAAHVGSVIAEQGYGFRITAIVAPTDPDSAFWADDPGLAAPGFTTTPKGDFWATAGFIGPAELPALESIASVEGSPESVEAVYCVPLDTGSYDVANFNSIISTLTSFDSGSTAAELGLQVDSGPIAVLTPFGEQRTTVDSILALVLTGAAAVGAVTILLCARLVIGRRGAHFALQRARGQSLLQLAAQVLGGLSAPTLAVLAAALALARVLGSGAPWSSQATLLFGAVALVSLGGPPIIAVLDHRGAATLQTGRTDLVRRRPRPRRRMLELLLLVLAVGAVVELRQQGLGEAGQGTNALGTLVPILLAAVATAIAVRCYPLLLGPAARAAARRGGPTSFLGLAGAARSALALALPTFVIVLTLTLAALGSMMNRTVEDGRVAASWQQTGADAVISLNASVSWSKASSAVSAIEGVPGVTHASVAYSQPDAVSGGVVYAVDPSSYAAVSADSPWPVDAGKLASSGGRIPALVSPDTSYPVGATIRLQPQYSSPLSAVVVGILPETAAAPAGATATSSTFVLIPSSAVAAQQQDWSTGEILVSGNGIDEGKLAAVLGARNLPATTTYRADTLNQLSNAPLETAAEYGYLIGILAAGCFGVCGILLSLTMSAAARDRRLMLLSTLGLTPRQARGVALAETTPLAAATVLGGLLAAAALPAVFGSSLNLSVFTGLSGASPLGYDVATPLLTAALAVVLTALGVVLQAALARRRGAPAQLRIGD